MTDPTTDERLRGFVGRPLGPPTPALLPVNRAMIAHWCDVFEYPHDAASDTAPAPMLQVWMMRTYQEQITGARPEGVRADLYRLLEDADYQAVVATDCQQEYVRELRLDEEIITEEIIDAISDLKNTHLGSGYFITTRITFRAAADDDIVGSQRWTIFKYRPKARPEPAPAEAPAETPADAATEAGDQPRPLRPRPAINRDNQFWFDGAARRELLIQTCSSCGELRHPPGPCCPHCNSFEWTTTRASGAATLFSFVVNHYPQVPAFDYPLPVVLVELEEGVRLIANVADLDATTLVIGMPLVLDWHDWDPDLTLPVFRAAQEETK